MVRQNATTEAINSIDQFPELIQFGESGAPYETDAIFVNFTDRLAYGPKDIADRTFWQGTTQYNTTFQYTSPCGKGISINGSVFIGYTDANCALFQGKFVKFESNGAVDNGKYN